MAKKIRTVLKVQAPAGSATAAPPVGPALGQHGINIMEFIKAFNERTANMRGYVVPAEITVYEDRSFTFITKAPLAAALLKRAAGVESGSGEPNREKVGSVTQAQLREIAETKMQDLNANTVTRVVRPVPCGSTTVPRTSWSAWRGSTPRRRCASTVASNLAVDSFGSSSAASFSG